MKERYTKLLNLSLKMSFVIFIVALISLSKIFTTTVLAESIGSELKMGQSLHTDQWLQSDNGQYYAVLQKDGNFVVYDKNNKAKWSSGTNSKNESNDYRISMQSDGNLVLYTQGWNAKWSTQTYQDQVLSFSLKIDNNGILRLLREGQCIWSSDSGKVLSVGNELDEGQTLSVGQYITSTSGLYAAKMQQDGQLVVYDKNGTAKWSSGKSDTVSNNYRLTMQSDGNLVIYSKGWNSSWVSDTPQSAMFSYKLMLTDDGNLKLFRGEQIIWNSINGKILSLGNQLQEGQIMAVNQYLVSSNNSYKAKLSSNGDFAIYNSSGNIIWDSKTSIVGNINSYYLSMQNDGNFVLYGDNWDYKWATFTNQATIFNFSIRLDDDGILRLFRDSKCVWNSQDGNVLSMGNQLNTNDVLAKGQFITSPNGSYKAIMESSGNFVLYDNSGNVVWTSKTQGNGSSNYRLAMQTDGNLVIYEDDWSAQWATKTNQATSGSFVLKLDNDGDLRLYNGNQMLWDSNRGKIGNLGSELNMGQNMWTNQYLQSPDGSYTARVNQNGDLTIYGIDGSVKWSTNLGINDSFTDYRLSMQVDGNLVLYGQAWNATWQTITNQAQGSNFTLRLDNTGDLIVLKDNQRIWDVNRGRVGNQGNTLKMGQTLWNDQYLQSDTGMYTARIQKDGNIVIYHKSGLVKWASYSNSNSSFTDYRLSMQNDGNLVAYAQDWNSIWQSKTDQAQGSQFSLVLSTYGDLRILKNGVCIWDTNASILGVLSAKYESNGDPGAISNNPGDIGGKSYGAWQFASKMGSVDSFLSWLKNVNYNYYQQLIAAKTADGDTFGNNFDNAWKSIAKADREVFLQLQHDYTKAAYYDSEVSLIKSTFNIDISAQSFALQNVIWSTAVQHGVYGARNILRAVDSRTSLSYYLNTKNDDETIINSIYDERSNVDKYFAGNSDSVKAAVKQRFADERSDAIKMLNNEYIALDG
ncbi:hypothetical protein IAI10_05630 [Clostridium sp. 19966]|uniref:VgrG-related protein n=1 Tax=Clostridium sp. 19966 TaxID=2768166 RepID=UPI0028DFBABD|nr:hypothetical protein [Clostridium sp. 19966]MDT8716128.1 hypothetical protein [Clostridium sp. 19966]